MPRQLRVEHFLQEEQFGCLAACVQMVLKYQGIVWSQPELNRLLGLTSAGTPASRVRWLGQFGVNVVYAATDEVGIQAAIEHGTPPIVFVKTGDLPYWNANLSHAVVIVGYTNADVFIHDPVFADSPKQVNWGDFMLAWSEFDYHYALIAPV